MNKTENLDVIPYLKSLFLPESGPASLPDDKVQRHSLRQETITYNFKSPESGSGAIVLFPNSPTELIGAHYILLADGTYKFDMAIRTAQELSDSYNYGRKISGLIKVRSSTLPAGVYALNGTMNAATYEGAPTEIGLEDYNSILQVTSNPMDKIGNVLVGDGIAVLTLPQGYDQPYLRLNDPSPSAVGKTRIRDASDSLVYTNYNYLRKIVNTDIEEIGKVKIAAFNVDTSIGFAIEGTLLITFDQDVEPTGEGYMRLDMIVYGLDGKPIPGVEEEVRQPLVTVTFSDKELDNYWVSFTGTFPTGSEFLGAPIGGISLEIVGQQIPPGHYDFELNSELNAWGGNSPGISKPVTIINYQQVAPGTAITISGVANYELIPNPVLARNITTEYGEYDPVSLNYAKRLLANRDKLGIRTVWRIADYYQREALFSEMATLKEINNEVAMAFGLGDILSGIKRLLVPIADAIIPGAGGFINDVGNFIGVSASMPRPAYQRQRNVMHSTAASGRPVHLFGRAASGRPLRFSYAMDSETADTIGVDPGYTAIVPGQPERESKSNKIVNLLEMIPEEQGATWIDLSTAVPVERPLSDTPIFRKVVSFEPNGTELGEKAVLFPTIVVNNGDHTPMGVQLYAVVNGDKSDMLPAQMKQVGYTKNNRRIFGYAGGRIPMNMKFDTTILPVSTLSKNAFTIDVDAPPVKGKSLMAAMYILNTLPKNFVGFPELIATGEIDETGRIYPVFGANLKNALSRESGLPLAANSDMVELPVKTTRMLTRYALDRDLTRDTQYTNIKFGLNNPAHFEIGGKTAWAAESDVEEIIDDMTRENYDEEEEWAELGANIARRNPTFNKLLKVMEWIERNNFLNEILYMAETDPNGVRMHNILLNSMPLAGSARQRRLGYIAPPETRRPPADIVAVENNANYINMMNKAERISAGSMSTGNTFATVEWVLNNGNRGPSESQIYHFRTTGQPPTPGMEYEIRGSIPSARRGGIETPATKAERTLTSRLGREPTQEELDLMIDYLNTHGGKAPDAATMNELFPTGKTSKRGTRQAVREANLTGRGLPTRPSRFSTLFGQGGRLV